MKTKCLLKSFATILIILFANNLFAQITSNIQKFLPNIIPPSPSAYSLGNYGNVPIGIFTGTPNLNIPLYTYKTTNLEVPIALFYGNNGIKVDEISSNVGQGWNLSFGGVISRMIRDEPDDKRQNDFVPLDDNFTLAQRNAYFKSIGEYDRVDSEMDLYSFNFGNYSGKFIYDYDGSLVLMPAQNIKIEKVIDNESFTFIITAPDGVKYYFSSKETTFMPKESGGRPLPIIATSAWYITKIVHPKGDEIYFNYVTKSDTYITSKSQSLTMQYPRVQYDCLGKSITSFPIWSPIYEHRIAITGQAIVSITSNNSVNGEIIFNYLENNSADVISGNKKINEIVIKKDTVDAIEKIKFTYSTTVNNRVFLDKIQYNDPGKNYQFEYLDKNNFPQRLSFSQDHWGYYNGKSNSNIVPNKTGLEFDNIEYGGANKSPDPTFAKIGMLSKIIYPTKGSTVFEYEPNDYYGTKEIIPEKKSLEKGIDNVGVSTKEITITSLSNQEVVINGAVSFNLYECPNGDAGKTRANVRALNTTTGSYEDFYTRFYNGELLKLSNSIQLSPGQPQEFLLLAEPNQTYVISITLGNFSLLMPQRSCTTAALNVHYMASDPYTIQTNLITGGMRVKSTKDYPDNNAVPVYKRFHYAAKNDLLKSSGNLGKKPFYLDYTANNALCRIVDKDGQEIDLNDLIKMVNITSGSITSLFDDNNSNVSYPYVTISNGNDTFINGGEEHKFRIHQNSSSKIFGDYNILSSPTGYGFLINGLPETVSYFNANKKTVSTITNYYENVLLKESKSYSARKHFELILTDYNNIYNLSIVEYRNSSYWNYLKSKEDVQYDLNGLNPIKTITNYAYNNPNHLQLSVQSTNSSSNELLETKYYYPLDPQIANEPFVSDLIAKNMINVPLKTEIFKNQAKLSEQKTEYFKTANNMLLSKVIYGAKFPNANTGVNQLEKKITYDLYDNKGNILQYTLEGGAPVAIIWGYNQTLPIAKIENITYATISAGVIANLQTLSVADIDNCSSASCTEEALRIALNSLRSTFPDAMVFSYTYNPLIGITSMTDPKGISSYYEYDLFNRLKCVKDQSLNVLQMYCYNYMGQVTDCSDIKISDAVLYKSSARTGSFTKDCVSGGTPSVVSYNQLAGIITSTISQVDADHKALLLFNTDGQSNANTYGDCMFYSAALFGYFQRKNCINGSIGSVPYGLEVGAIISNVSQEDADTRASSMFQMYGQAYANERGSCR